MPFAILFSRTCVPQYYKADCASQARIIATQLDGARYGRVIGVVHASSPFVSI